MPSSGGWLIEPTPTQKKMGKREKPKAKKPKLDVVWEVERNTD